MSKEMEKASYELSPTENERTYHSIRGYVIEAQHQIYRAVNSAMVEAYWKIGKEIYEACGENERAAYGKQILAELSARLTAEFGKGYTVRNLRHMRQFYLAFPKRHTLCAELSWSHYRLLMRIADKEVRDILHHGMRQIRLERPPA